MAEQGIIDNIVSQKVFDELVSLNKSLMTTLSLVEKIVANPIGGGAGGSKPTSVPSAKPYDEVSKAMQKISQLEKEIQALTQKSATEYGKLTKTINEQTVSKNALQKQSRLEAASVSESVGAYARLVAQYELAKKAVLDLGAANGMTGSEFDNAKLKAATLEKEIQKLHTVSGQYGKGANNMYNSTFQLTQVMRELPNFAIDARIGFMSLSNNLPMLADGFKQLANSTVKVTDAFGNVTEKTLGNAGAWKAMAKSLLSLNTIMIVASTLMIMFGDKFLDLFKKQDSSRAAMEAYSKSLKEGSSEFSTATKNVIEMQSAMASAEKGVISQTEATNIFNRTLGKSFGEAKNFTEVQTLMGQKAGVYVKAMALMAQANAFLQEAIKNAGEAEDLRNDKVVTFWQRSGSVLKNLYTSAGKAFTSGFLLDAKGVVNAGKDFSVEILDLDDKIREDRLVKAKKSEDAMAANAKSFQDLQAEANGIMKDAGIVTDEKSDKNKKLTASYKSQIDAINVLALRSKSWMETVGDMASKNENAANQFATLQTSIENISFENAKNDLAYQYDQDKFNLDKSLKDKSILQSDYNDKLSALNQNNATKLESIELEHANTIESINNTLSDNLISLATERDKEIEDNHKTFLKTSLDGIKAVNADYNKEQKQKDDDEVRMTKEKENLKYDIVKSSIDALMNLFDSFNEKYQQSLDEQSEYLDKIEQGKLDKIKEANDAGLMSDEDYSDKQKLIQDQAEADQLIIDEKRKKAQRDAFLAKQAAAVAEIAINTAIKITSPENIGGVLTPLYLTLAGLQTAAVLAQTIPYFENGGTTKSDGNIIVNEKRRELVVEPSGRSYIPQTDEPTMINVPKGTRIYPDAAKLNNEAIRGMIMMNVTQNGTDMSEVIKHLDKLDKSILSLKQKEQKGDSMMEKAKFARRFNKNN